ncbi:MAG TPA: tetratricopeptide repeat protein, partial [Planctomycetia bacterium]|nr:tetratricopeptide repeat protein [Planctomycetia bacterium]
IHEALQSQQFADAVKRIDAELKAGKVGSPDYLMYLKGRAQTELSAFDEAIATFGDLEEKYPKGNWAARARFGRADVAARQRNYRAAGEIYLAEAERLLSAGRRDELTGIYLEFADRHFEGIAAKDPSQKKQPDYQNALTWYSESLKLQPSIALRQKIEFRIARSQQELAQHGDAINGFAAWMQRYAAEKTPKNDRASAALEVEARFHLGRAQLAAGQPAEARKTWQDFITSAAAKDAGGELIAEAQYKLASTYGIPQPGSVGEMELGIVALERFLKAFPKHALAAKAELETAQSYVHHGRFDQAAAKLKALIANEAYAKTDELAEARRLLGQSYHSQKKFPESIAAWKEFLDQHPNNAKWSEVQTMVIDAEFQIAAEHARKKDFAAARGAWETFLNKYPLDGRAPGILFRFGQMKYAEAVALRDAATKEAKEAAAKGAKDPDAKEAANKADAKTTRAPLPDAAKKLLDEAIADWERLVSKYPGSSEASQAAFSIGVTLEDQLARLPEA